MWPSLAIAALVAALCLLGLWLRARRREAGLSRALAETKRRLGSAVEEHERLLAQAMVRREVLFDSMGDGVLLLDAHGVIQLVNRAFCRLFHIKPEVQGQPVEEAIHVPALQAVIRKAREQRAVSGTEIELSGVDRRVLEVNATLIHGSGEKSEGIILVLHDLTRLKLLENTRQEFVANVSHELRTPLSMIKGYVETLLDGARHDPAATEKFLGIVLKHTDRLTFLIEDLLTISRLESGAVAMDLRPVPLRGVADRVLEDLRQRTLERRVTLLNQVPEDLVAQADADRIQQVLFNLIDNAMKYGRPDGHVWIGGGRLGSSRVEVWVRDDGPGIPADALNRIYERFYRVDRARSRDQGGTGLGLAIVKHIVQSHGGEVRTESESGQGATFRFTLPAPGNGDPAH